MKLLSLMSLILLLVASCSPPAEAASVRKAEMLNRYGLRVEAKKELIAVLFSDAGVNEKAKAYYLLGEYCL